MISNDYTKCPVVYQDGILGVPYDSPEGLFSSFANGDNHFLLYGIAEHSLLLVNRKLPFEPEKLSVFQTDKIIDGERQMKLSLNRLEDFPYIGRVVMTINRYD
ncbi:MAG: hypothetical protein HFF84_11115 [Oscillibacter sp.]|nr:hypothetical protein [Oscillibacter sp.]